MEINRIAAASLELLVSMCLFSAGEMLQPQRIIDCNTAGILPRASYQSECRIYPNGDTATPGCGMMLGITAGITNRLNIGLSYGGDGIIGRKSPVFNPHIGALIKYRIVEESYFVPALAFGYDHQGFGGIDGEYNGYVFKSQGFFLVVSKNYLLFTKVQIGLHGGIDYSLEEYEKIKWPNGYAGVDMGINEELAIAVEYNLALNQRDPGKDSTKYANPFDGFLNAGVRWSFTTSLYMEFDVKDLLQNKVNHGNALLGWDRELKLVYLQHF
jgi:hypothetical protein